MDLPIPFLKILFQVYCWGFFISLAFFLVVMLMRGCGREGYFTHIAACFALSLAWPYSWYEIFAKLMVIYGG